MAGGEILLWLTKTAGGQAFKSWMSRHGTQAEIRSLKRALRDSQDRRDELEGAADLLGRVAGQRDEYFAEIVRLRAENAKLRTALEQPKRPRKS